MPNVQHTLNTINRTVLLLSKTAWNKLTFRLVGEANEILTHVKKSKTWFKSLCYFINSQISSQIHQNNVSKLEKFQLKIYMKRSLHS